MAPFLAGLLVACGSSRAPVLENVQPGPEAELWLHDPIVLDFSDRVQSTRGGIRLVTDQGTVLAFGDYSTSGTVSVTVDDRVTYSGDVHLIVDDTVTGENGGTVEPVTMDWSLAPWTVDGPGVAPGEAPTAPGLARADELYTSDSFTAMVWTEGPPTSRRSTGVVRQGSSWVSMGYLEGLPDGDPQVAFESMTERDAIPCFVVVVGFFDARWCNGWSEPRELIFTGPAAVASTGPWVAYAGEASGGLAVRSDGVYSWETTENVPLPASRIVGRPGLAMRDGDLPALAFFDELTPGQIVLQVYRFRQQIWENLGAYSVVPNEDPPSIAVFGEHVYVAWTDISSSTARVEVADVTSSGWTLLDEPGSETASSHGAELTVDRAGIVHASWIEDGTSYWTGNVAMWTGAGWTLIDSFADRPLAATMQLAGGAAPIVAWRDLETVHVGLFNGKPGMLAERVSSN